MSDVQEKSKLDELSASDTLLLGLVTEDVDTTLIQSSFIYCSASCFAFSMSLVSRASYSFISAWWQNNDRR